MQNIDRLETEKFDRLAGQWWDPDGPLRTLHDINPLRLDYVERRSPLSGKKVLDIGCGAGIFSEALARRDADVTAIDTSEQALTAAREHAQTQGLQIDYRQMTAETLAELQPAAFDVVCCMELLEHVPDPVSVISSCAALVKTGGDAFFSTINRTPLAYGMAVLGAEYLLRLLPAGTHDYRRFIRPAELCNWCEQNAIAVRDISGMGYLPLFRRAFLTGRPAVNYLLHGYRG